MRLTLLHYTTQKVIGYDARLDYMRALKAGNATPGSSAAFCKILKHAKQAADAIQFSIDKETGLREFGAGPVSNAQSGGWSEDDKRPEHQFLRVNGGFLSINVFRKEGSPKIIFTHYDVDGKVVNQEQFER